MPSVGLDAVAPGAVLSAPVADFHGNLLLDAGAELTPRNLRVLKSWGVTMVEVDGPPVTEDPVTPPETAATAAGGSVHPVADAQSRDQNPVMAAIMDAAGKVMNRHTDGHEDP
jgi:hypothetical protein